MSLNRRFCATVSGRVQGVGYRFFVQRTAVQMHLTGFVKNNPDRTVTVEAQGSEVVLKEFVEKLRTGSGLARIESIQLNWLQPRSEDKDFQISF